jgi:hypothetical protein
LQRPTILGVPAVEKGPRLDAPARPESENRTTSRPVRQANYFQLLPSPPKTAPVRTIGTVHEAIDDGGWRAAHD